MIPKKYMFVGMQVVRATVYYGHMSLVVCTVVRMDDQLFFTDDARSWTYDGKPYLQPAERGTVRILSLIEAWRFGMIRIKREQLRRSRGETERKLRPYQKRRVR